MLFGNRPSIPFVSDAIYSDLDKDKDKDKRKLIDVTYRCTPDSVNYKKHTYQTHVKTWPWHSWWCPTVVHQATGYYQQKAIWVNRKCLEDKGVALASDLDLWWGLKCPLLPVWVMGYICVQQLVESGLPTCVAVTFGENLPFLVINEYRLHQILWFAVITCFGPCFE